MVTKILNLLLLLSQAVTWILNKYVEKETEKKYENARDNTANVWVDGFGVRRETKDDPTKTNIKQ